MESGKKFLMVTTIVITWFILQGLLIIADQNSRPAVTAVKFIKAYYMLDDTMANYLCRQLKKEGATDAVRRYLRRVDAQGRAMGFAPDYMRRSLFHIEATTRIIDASRAQVRITARSRRCINPFYALVARVFFLGESHAVDTVITLVKENGHWKVCSLPAARIQA